MNSLKTIEFINISNTMSEDLFQWIKPGSTSSKFKLDIIAIKSMVKTPNIFYQINRHGLKICFILENNLIFAIGGIDSLQYQYLEAILEEIMNQFIEFYGDIATQYSGAFSDAFNGFNDFIFETISNINKKITYVRAPCKACNANIKVCIKNSLVTNAKDFPVSIVYIHEGHGLLIYIDASFKVRGAEIVKISG